MFSRPKLKQYFLNCKIKEHGHSENRVFLAFDIIKKIKEKLKLVMRNFGDRQLAYIFTKLFIDQAL
jgi:hypothetical protein